jgi:hypothetical protein
MVGVTTGKLRPMEEVELAIQGLLPASHLSTPMTADARIRQASDATYRLSGFLLISGIVLQKFAVPGTGNSESSIPLTMIALFAVIFVALCKQVLVVDGWRLAAFMAFLSSAAVSLLLSNSQYLSTTSWAYMAVIQATFIFRFAEGRFDFQRIMAFVSNIAVLSSIAGVAQFFAQFAVGRQYAFFIEFYTPPTMLLSGFNFMNPIIWDSPILKSNGVFFAEPSFFCQFLAIGLIVELLRSARPLRLAILGMGIVCSYSGTGLMTLALFVPWYIVKRRRYDLIILGGVCLVILLTQAQSLQLSAITDRVDEFTNPSSSGFGRFFSIFFLLRDFIFTDLQVMLFGRGPGTVREYWSMLYYGAFDPTWGKIVYEYGVVGSFLYAIFFTKSFFMSRKELRIPLAFTYFLLGGYLANSSVVLQLLVLVAWPAVERRKLAEAPRAFA